MPSKLSEFELIERFFRQLSSQEPMHTSDSVAVGIGDDCAVINLPANKQLCLSIDTMVEGVHFPAGFPSDKIAYRALAAALSDLAAMGAEPSHFSVALTLPRADERWLEGFANGLATLANQAGVVLVGGDTTKGPLTVSIQVHGYVEYGESILRSNAQVGDLVVVTGTLGDAGAGLTVLDQESLSEDETRLYERYCYPSARLQEGKALPGVANSCIDISDGLVADAAHIAKASNCQINIDIDSLPLSSALRNCAGKQAMNFALSAGDDYELLFTVPEENWPALKEAFPEMAMTKIGQVTKGAGIKLYRQGKEVTISTTGYQHFEPER